MGDREHLTSVTEAIQAAERLQLSLRLQKSATYFNKVYPEVCKTLDSLRKVKSEIEGTSMTFESVTVKDAVLEELKPHILMHVPQSLTIKERAKIQQLVIKAFNGSCRNVLYIALVTCPWYSATQTERGQQAKYNHLLVIYCTKDDQFFSPINPHLRENSTDVIDKGWFYAIEVSHFADHLLRGKVRFIETLYHPESFVIFSSAEWRSLNTLMEPINCLNLRGFLEQCRGQAVGSVGKKSKATGKIKIRDEATLHDFCNSFRLLHHATNALLGQELVLERFNDEVLSPEIAQDAILLLKACYQTEHCNKMELLDIIMKWRALVDKMMVKCTYTGVGEVQHPTREWLLQVRSKGRPLPKTEALKECEKEVVESLLTNCIGGLTSAMIPENVIMITRAGSYLYNLDTVDSDADYIIIYADPVQKILSSCHRPTECAESRGPEKALEYGAYEVRRFCEMLWKGSIVMLELVFAEKLDYTSSVWKDLVSKRELFITEQAISQYIGLIKNNMADIEAERFIGTKRENKLFYQILHKLFCLEFFLKRECPQIRCEKTIREYILRVRKGPLEGNISRNKLYEECKNKLDFLRRQLSQRTTRLPENINYKYLADWLMKVRGWKKSS